MEKKTLGSFLSALRRAQGLTQQEVADRLMVSNRAVSRWERDEAMPDILLLPAIADLFGVTVDELLRGERKREAYSSSITESESAAASTATEQPASEATQPEPNPRTLRGLRAMLYHAQSRFRSCVILSLSFTLAGLFIMMGISYSFYRPTIGFVVLLIFLTGSLTTTILAATRLRDFIDEQVSNPETRLPDEDLYAACRFYAAELSRVIWVAITALLITLPLVLIRDSKFVHSVLSAEIYAPMAILIGIACMVAILCLNEPVMRLLCKPWKDTLGVIIGHTAHQPTLSRHQLSLTLWQIIPATVGIVGATFVANHFVSEETAIDYIGILACSLLLSGITAACVAFPLHLRKESKGSYARRDLMISGVRNFILIAVGILTAGNGVTFVQWSEDGKTWETGQIWNESVIILGIVVGLAVILGAELLRRHLQKKKP
ncbi:MAG: helix-turn-helix transcriptional regulator [Clostridia bacterium]|nr:helix-turn-helix transcriptional regulator [Clostridia bacterium]